MFENSIEKTISRLILIGMPLTTIFLLTDTVTDPVNAPKLVLAGSLGLSMLMVIVFFNVKQVVKKYRNFLVLIVLFNLALLNSMMQSDSPLTQQVYGVYGRNNGFVAYFIFSCIAVGVLGLKMKRNFLSILRGLQIAGFANLLYCLWVLMFGDFLSWSNPYGNILGFFGNPNFISAFLGIFITSTFALMFTPGMNWKTKVISILAMVVAFVEVLKSHAIQGIAVTILGIGVVLFYLIRNHFKSWKVDFLYLVFSTGLGVIGILGALQIGPLGFIYKRSVSLRGIYWETAINMGVRNPLSGVGLDSYGDWYRSARPLKALTEPGVDTTSNAAHNVILDFFANGGWPLLLTYLGILAAGLTSIVRITLRSRIYDPVFVSIAVIWLTYQVQSIISINQIGLAIWGWLSTGALVAYERISRTLEDLPTDKSTQWVRMRNKSAQGVISPQLVAGIGVVVGALFSSPPMAADIKWRSALDSRDALRAIDALRPSLFNPSDSQRYAQAVQLFANSELSDQALQLALNSVEFNPNNYQSWRNLYFLPNVSSAKKSIALANLRRLDPLNPEWGMP